MSFVLLRDLETDQVHVYSNLTIEATIILRYLLEVSENANGMLSIYYSDKPYDSAIAEEFKRTGEVSGNDS